MTEFEYDCYQKKQIAHSAKHRKNGSKSKKCSMTSDHLTRRQWEQKNGPVTTYYLNYPTTWSDFQFWPPQVQTEYINGLVRQYRVTDAHLAGMLGISDAAFMKYRKTKMPDAVVKELGYHMSEQEAQSWKSFVQLDRVTEEVNRMARGNTIGGDKPMTKEEFVQLSKDNQEHILKYWQQTYGANGGDIARMLGWTSRGFNQYIHHHDLDVTFRKGVKMNRDQRARWEDMLNGRVQMDLVKVDAEPADAADAVADDSEKKLTKEQYDQISTKGLDCTSTTYDEYMANKAADAKKHSTSARPNMMRERNFVFKGQFTSTEILDAIASMIGNGETFKGEFEISCKMIEVK